MSKIGEGKNSPINDYHKALEHSCVHFLMALRQYPTASPDERKRLRSVMDEHAKLIQSAVDELKRRGISKEAVLFEKSYRTYVEAPSEQNRAALEHNLATLRDFNC